jgi:hypothetical protein
MPAKSPIVFLAKAPKCAWQKEKGDGAKRSKEEKEY